MTTIELKELACYLPALVDELPLNKESGSTDNLLLGDVLDALPRLLHVRTHASRGFVVIVTMRSAASLGSR